MLIYPIFTHACFRLANVLYFLPSFRAFHISIYIVTTKNIRNIHAVLTNQIADIADCRLNNKCT